MIPVGIVLDSVTLCNLVAERKILDQAIERGEHIVIFGRRNTGKTSLVKGVCVPHFLQRHTVSVAVEVDFLGVDSVAEIQTRIRIALEKGLSKAFPKKQAATKLLSTLAKLRPRIGIEAATGNFELKLAVNESPGSQASLETYFEEIAGLASKFPLLLVMDEFQDLDFVKGAVARVRTCLQSISSKLPIVVLGSKKHLLARIFAAHRAPMAGWGRDLEVGQVVTTAYQDAYFEYASRYFSRADLKIEKTEFIKVCTLLQGIPEAINIVLNLCLSKEKSLSSADFPCEIAVKHAVEEKGSRFEEVLSRFSPSERTLLAAIAKHQPVLQLKAKSFLAFIPGIAPTSVTHAARKLEDKAEIYKEAHGFVIADPLLGEYLKATR